MINNVEWHRTDVKPRESGNVIMVNKVMELGIIEQISQLYYNAEKGVLNYSSESYTAVPFTSYCYWCWADDFYSAFAYKEY